MTLLVALLVTLLVALLVTLPDVELPWLPRHTWLLASRASPCPLRGISIDATGRLGRVLQTTLVTLLLTLLVALLVTLVLTLLLTLP